MPLTPDDDVAKPRRHPLRSVLTVAVAVTVAAGTFSVVRSHSAAPAPRPTGLSGTLVYAVRDGDWARLWRWDLATGAVNEGPRVRDPLELVNAFGAEFGWVGVTSLLPDGRQRGSILRYLGPRDVATPLQSGDLVTWGARGEAVVAATRKQLHGCRHHITIDYEKLVPTIEERQVDRTLCGNLLSIGRDGALTYFTIRSRGDVSIRFAGYGRSHPILDGYALASVSLASDLLVVPGASPRSVASSETPVTGTASFFQGLGSHPVPFGTKHVPFHLYLVLGWTPDARSALVAGSMGARNGMFELEVGPNGEHASPRFIGPLRGPTWATYTDQGAGIVEMDGSLYTLSGDRLTPLQLPPGAPRPFGPLVWIR